MPPHPPHHHDAALDPVTVIMVTYNSAHCIRALVGTLAKLPHIIVIDNASHDDTLKIVRAQVGHAKIISNPLNVGFGTANNQGLAMVSTPFALLLNPDCEIEVDAVKQLLHTAAHHPTAALVIPQILESDGKVDVNYRWSPTSWAGKGPGADGLCCVGFACGAVWLVRMSIWQQTGGFDESFFLYYEDDDVCQRLFDARHSILLDPSIRVTHKSRGSVGGQRRWRSEYLRGFHHAQSKILFASKYKGAQAARHLHWKVLTIALMAMPVRVLLFSPPHIARLAGRIVGLFRLFDSGVFPASKTKIS